MDREISHKYTCISRQQLLLSLITSSASHLLSVSVLYVVSSPDRFSSPRRKTRGKYGLGTLGTISWASLVQRSGIWAHQSDCELQVINSKHRFIRSRDAESMVGWLQRKGKFKWGAVGPRWMDDFEFEIWQSSLFLLFPRFTTTIIQ